MKSLRLRIFDSICLVSTNLTPVHDHLRFVYERCRVKKTNPPDLRFELVRNGEGNFKVGVEGAANDPRSSLLPALLALEWEMTRRALFRNSNLAAFHAAWVARDDTALVLVGEGGSGKSTLSFELAREGWAYGSDEAAAFSGGDGRLIPFPRRILLKEDNPLITRRHLPQSRRNLLALMDGRYYVWPPKVNAAPPGCYDCYYFFLHFQPQGRFKTTPLETLDALKQLLAARFFEGPMSPALFHHLVQTLGPNRAFEVCYSSPVEVKKFLHRVRDEQI